MKKRVLLCCAALLALVCASAGATDWEFSDRDRDGTYDEESAVYIQLSGDGVFIDGDGATAEGSAVTIADEGVYVLSGTLSDGRVIVNAGEDDKVQIVLAGADIHCETYAALYVEEADKVFLTLEDGTQNRLSCGAEFALASEDDNVDAAVFSRAAGRGPFLFRTSTHRPFLASVLRCPLLSEVPAFLIFSMASGIKTTR